MRTDEDIKRDVEYGHRSSARCRSSSRLLETELSYRQVTASSNTARCAPRSVAATRPSGRASGNARQSVLP
jgi:hypothetical protein